MAGSERFTVVDRVFVFFSRETWSSKVLKNYDSRNEFSRFPVKFSSREGDRGYAEFYPVVIFPVRC
jgi:hypothetical protein